MMFSKVKPLECRLMTWECSSSFETVLSEQSLFEKFSSDMMGPSENTSVHLWPMISFNSLEGRLYRVLVVQSVQAPSMKKRRGRLLPEQIDLFFEADKIMKESPPGGTSCNSGNYLFWCLRYPVLHILVFFEGRLCHWSEESGYDDASDLSEKIQQRLIYFRLFLQQDNLFSRGENFEEREISCPWNRRNFLLASRDPFFKNRSLNAKRRWRVSKVKLCLTVLFLGIVFLCAEMMTSPAAVDDAFEIPDVIPVELLDPPMVENVIEPREHLEMVPKENRLEKDSLVESRPQEIEPLCNLPSIRLKGIVGGKVAVVEGRGLEKGFLYQGDSLDRFVVQNVGRDRLILTCGNHIEEVLVQ